ncbi:MAG: response regulator transcription factor [Chloroflexi bacterium]|nr:response regulator transcription factor [Chloroflexota bacterium]
MDRTETMKQVSPGIERLAIQRARGRANVAKWDLNVAIFSYAILSIIIILVSQGVGLNVVATLAVCGLIAVWVIGRRQGKRLYQRFYSEEVSDLQQKPSEQSAALVAHLTPREIETLHYVAQGYSNKRIALELGISEQTIKNFVSGILTKLNANDRTEATVIAIKHGLISIE